LEERIRRHLSNHSGFTTVVKDWKVVYTENFDDKAQALKREKEIKNWKSKQRIKKLISSVE
jgi:putative endonuclease